MNARMNYGKVAPEPPEADVRAGGVPPRVRARTRLLERVKTRVSQINGCAFCLDMHTQDARAAGETEQRLYLLSAWREAPFYSDRERAALAWAEALTRLDGVPDEVYEDVRGHFTEKELVDLTYAVVAINGWNRLAISFRAVPGTYKPR